jgi:hypothetical protein
MMCVRFGDQTEKTDYVGYGSKHSSSFIYLFPINSY